jgi:predicted ABC-type sugar transport system permease subunit
MYLARLAGMSVQLILLFMYCFGVEVAVGGGSNFAASL